MITTLREWRDRKNVNESMDRSGIDMQADWDRLNDMMFGGALRRVPLRWMTSKHRLGVMTYDGPGVIKYVGVSDFYDMSRQQYLDVLAHEMIHVWLEQSGVNERDAHGPRFLAKVRELNERFPDFDIKKSENAEGYSVTAGKKSKEYGAVVFKDGDKYSVVVADARAVSDERAVDDFIEGIRKHALRGFSRLEVKMYLSRNPELAKFKVKRSLSLKSMELFVLKPELAKELESDELVRSVVLK
jgi:predicted metallopeptidase